MTDDRALGPEMTAEGWFPLSGDDLMWVHAPSHRCITLHAAPRQQCEVPCWGPEPADPKTAGYFVACRVHDEDGGDPLYGDAFWVESYTTALKVARRTRLDILAETPAHARSRQRELARRGHEAWDSIRALCANNPKAPP